MRVIWTDLALTDLDGIGDHIALDNPSAAYRTVNKIYDTTNKLLSENPMIGRRGRDPKTRELVISGTPYIVGYRVPTDQVEILVVMHGAQEWPDEL